MFKFYTITCFLIITLCACTATPEKNSELELAASQGALTRQNIDKVFIVDCVLPGQVRRMGSSVNYVTARRPVRTSAIDCELRGGEYVAFDRADYASAMNTWMPQAQQGDPESQTNLGEIYEKGLGIAPDYELALIWYKKAAAQGYSRAQINLGYLYEKGLGVKQDLAEAMNWYRIASGLPDAIEFISSVELQSKNTQIDELKSELLALQKEADALKLQLQDSQRQLNDISIEKSKTEVNINSLKLQIAELESKQKEKNSQTDSNNFAQVLQELHSKLQRRESDLRQQGILISKLTNKSQDYQQKITEIQSRQQLAMAAPTIEIIEPPVALTRGKPSILFRSVRGDNSIFGRVNAPAGIRSFTVNSTEVTLEANNTFHIPLNLVNANNELHITAIDNRARQAELDISIARTGNSSTPPPRVQGTNHLGNVKLGNYYALIIGNNSYTNLPELKTAVNDAKKIEDILSRKYNFKTQLLLNADRYQILSAFNDIRSRLTAEDNFLIYYAGHGDLDRATDRGYWLPVDAEISNTANWISNVTITDMINTLPAKHVLVVADSCYSGTMTRTAVPRMSTELPASVQENWLKLMAKSRSRTALTSGGLQPVLDAGGGAHSVFAEVFIKALENNDGLLQGYSLYRSINSEVTIKTGNIQTPEYAPIKHSGHETGQFFFMPKV